MMKFHVWHEVPCLAMFISYLIQAAGLSCLQIETFDGNMYVATTSALTWCIVVALVFPFNFPPSAAPCKL